LLSAAPPPACRLLINFSKRRKIAAVIARIQTYQNGVYPLEEVPSVRAYRHERCAAWEAALLDDIRGGVGQTARKLDEAMMALSLKLEPRRGNTEVRRGSVMPGTEMARSPRAAGSNLLQQLPPLPLPSPRRGSMPNM